MAHSRRITGYHFDSAGTISSGLWPAQSVLRTQEHEHPEDSTPTLRDLEKGLQALEEKAHALQEKMKEMREKLRRLKEELFPGGDPPDSRENQ